MDQLTLDTMDLKAEVVKIHNIKANYYVSAVNGYPKILQQYHHTRKLALLNFYL